MQEEQHELTTIKGRRKYIQDAWLYIASASYLGYKEHGRGALLFEFGAEDDEESGLKYMPEGANYGNLEAVKFVETYNPESQVVVIFNLRELGTASGIYHGDPSPPGAVDMLKKGARGKR